MVRLLARTLNFLLLGVVCINTEIRADLFQAEPLVQIPGFNTQFTVLKHESPTQIAWVNILDDLYSIYVQQIFYEIEAPVLVVSGNNPIYDPGIIYTLWGEEKTGLVWSDCDSTGWSLNYKEYLNGAWGDTFVIVDSLSDSIRSSAGSNGVSWTSSGSLYYFRLFGLSPDSTWQFPTLIDTFGCNNPQIIDGSRRRRITRGSGTIPQDVNQLLSQHRQVQKIMKQIGRGGKLASMFGLR